MGTKKDRGLPQMGCHGCLLKKSSAYSCPVSTPISSSSIILAPVFICWVSTAINSVVSWTIGMLDYHFMIMAAMSDINHPFLRMNTVCCHLSFCQKLCVWLVRCPFCLPFSLMFFQRQLEWPPRDVGASGCASASWLPVDFHKELRWR